MGRSAAALDDDRAQSVLITRRRCAVTVNAAHPGYTRTDLNDGSGDIDAHEAAATAVRLAMLPPDGPGTFVTGEATLPW